MLAKGILFFYLKITGIEHLAYVARGEIVYDAKDYIFGFIRHLTAAKCFFLWQI